MKTILTIPLSLALLFFVGKDKYEETSQNA